MVDFLMDIVENVLQVFQKFEMLIKNMDTYSNKMDT